MRLQRPQIGITVVTIPTIITTVAGRERGMAAGLAGPSRVASVSPIDTVHGTCMDRHQATSDGGADILEAASLGRPLHFYHAGKGRLVCERWWRRSRWRGLALRLR